MRTIERVLFVFLLAGIVALIVVVAAAKAGVIPGPDWPSWIWVIGVCVAVWLLLRCAGWAIMFAERKKTSALSDPAAAVDYLKQYETTIVREERVDRRD
jgi:hypothetical protein